MKFLVTIALAVLAAASGVTAQDTLLIRSYRTVDVCSSERRWLIAPYLGNIRSTDSLASFDITIGFDTTLVRPTDVLTENTLSFMADYPAQMTLVIPGEMRVAGFNITRNMIGDKPLFAVVGDYRGSCNDDLRFTFPWPPTFNEEFKKKMNVLISEKVAVVATPKNDNQLGVLLEPDTIVIDGKDSTSEVVSTVSFGSSSATRATLTWWLGDTLAARIDQVSLTGVTIDSMDVSGRSVRAHVVFQSGERPTASIVLRNVTTDVEARASLRSRMEVTDSCACVRSTLSDTMQIKLTNPIVSVSSPVDDSNERLDVTPTSVSCHCDHGQTNEIAVFTIAGERVAMQRSLPGSVNRMSIENLPSGPYIIVGTCGDKRLVNLNLK